MANVAAGQSPAPRPISASPKVLPLAGGPSRDQRFLLGLCGAVAAGVPLCLFLGTRGFAPLIGLAGLLCIPKARPASKDWTGAAILAALVLWAAISVAWSPAPNLHVFGSAKALSRLTDLHLALQLVLCTGFVTALARLDRIGAQKALGWVALGFLAVSPLLIEEGLTKVKLYPALLALVHVKTRLDWLIADMAQGGYVVAVVAWPLGVALLKRGRPILAVALAAFTPLSMLLLRGAAPTLALAASLPCFFLALRGGPRAIGLLAGLTAIDILATPLIMLAADHLGFYARFKAELAPSWSDRLRMWAFVAERIAAHPWRGAGLDASRMFPGVVRLHPHNGPLQLWYELGLPGALLGALFWLWLWRRIADCARRDRLQGATAAAAATVYLTIGGVSFGLWQEWWLCVGALAMTLCILLGKALEPAEPDQ